MTSVTSAEPTIQLNHFFFLPHLCLFFNLFSIVVNFFDNNSEIISKDVTIIVLLFLRLTFRTSNIYRFLVFLAGVFSGNLSLDVMEGSKWNMTRSGFCGMRSKKVNAT